MPLVPTPKNCDPSVKKAIQILTQKLGLKSNPIHNGLTLTGLTASRLIATDASKVLESTDLNSWVTGTSNQITVVDDADGTITLSIPNPFAIPGKLTAGSFGSPTDVTVSGQYGFELHYSGNNYNVTGIRSRAQLVTTDTSAQAQGGLFQAANNDNINAGVLNGLVAEAIGKATTNAATITMMRGALVGAEWSAKDTVTDLRTLHVRIHTRDAATEGYISGTGYGLYIENEAVGGNGQVLTAGIYFKGTNLSAGNKAFTHGIDFSGATYGTADIKLSDSSVINDVNDRWGVGTATPNVKFHIKSSSATSEIRIEGDGFNARLSLNSNNLGSRNFSFESNGANVLFKNRSDSNGQFLVQSSSPTKNCFVVDFAAPANSLVVEETGVGIGTASPDTKLQVVGDCKFGDDNTNYTTIEADGTIKFNGAATVWKDINIGAGTLSGPPGLQPGIVNFVDEVGADTGIATYGLAVGEGLSGLFEIQHDYKEGSDITFHVHWQGIAAPTGTDKVQFQLTYTVTSEGIAETLDAVTVITTESDFDTQYESPTTSFTAITGTNLKIGDQFLFTLQRIAASANEYGGEALLQTIGIHYEIDTVGSRAITTK